MRNRWARGGRAGPWLAGWMAAWTAWVGSAESFSLGGQAVDLQPAGNQAPVFLRAIRPNPLTATWNVEVVVSNTGPSVLRAPFVLRVESLRNSPGVVGFTGTDSTGRAFLDVSDRADGGGLGPGQTLRAITLTLGRATAVPEITLGLYSQREAETPAVARIRSMTADGLPLPGALVVEEGAATRTQATEARLGLATVGGRPGEVRVRLEAPDRGPSWARFDVAPGRGLVTPVPPLSPRSAGVSTNLGPDGGILAVGSARLELAPGTPGVPGAEEPGRAVALQAFTGADLPAFLPAGWRLAAAARYEGPAGREARLFLRPEITLAPATEPVLARWEEKDWRWRVASVRRGGGDAPLELAVGPGLYALVLRDAGAGAPGTPAVGDELPAGTLPAPAAGDLAAGGAVDPAARPASPVAGQVTAVATAWFTNRVGALASGTVFRCDVQEEYLLRDGSRRVPPRHERFVVGQRPGLAGPTNVLEARFPLRPLLLLGGEELAEAVIRVEVLGVGAFPGVFLPETGGALADGGVVVRLGAGDLAGAQVATLVARDPAEFAGVAGEGLRVAAAFELGLPAVAAGRRLAVGYPGQLPQREFVLARTVMADGAYGLQPVERLASGPEGVVRSVEPATGAVLPGVDGPGQYLLVEVPARPGVVEGVAREAGGAPRAGLAVRTGPWLSLTDAAGRYRLVASPGAGAVAVTDLRTGDAGSAGFAVADAAVPVAADVAVAAGGLRVVSVTPADGATGVPRVSPVGLAFSRPVNPATVLGGAIRLRDAAGQVVEATVSLNLRGTVATLLPARPLAAGVRHTVELAATLADAGGSGLEGGRSFGFTTETDFVRRADAGLAIFEPDGQGQAVMLGGAGLAEPGSPVILVNETTGFTSTVLARVDGSFTNRVPADVDDTLSAVLVNRNGTRTAVPAGRQVFRDGSVALFGAGGTVDFGPAEAPFTLVVDPGAVPGKTRFRLEGLAAEQLTAATRGQAPAFGRLLGGMRYQETGDPVQAAVDVAFPVAVADLGLPAGADPAQASYGLVIPREYEGRVVFELVDTMSFEATTPGRGRLVTRSPPFPGLLARKLAAMQAAAGRVSTLGQAVVSRTDPVDFGVMQLDLSAGGKIAGHVRSRRLDAGGQPVGEPRPVAGALVMVDLAADNRPPGLLRPGELVAASDENGVFATYLRPSVQDIARLLVATHPRFPFQVARVGVPALGNNTAVARVELFFNETTTATGPVTGSARPVLQPAHDPPLPSVGTGEGAGALFNLLAVDDGTVGTPEVTVVSVEGERGEILPNNRVTLSTRQEARASAGRTVVSFRVFSEVRARVRLRLAVGDDLGLQTQLDYSLNFGLGVAPPPASGTDRLGPYVTLSWPPDGAENVPSLAPIVLRLAEPVAPPHLAPAALAGWLALDPRHRLRHLEASPDRREFTLYYDGDVEGAVQLTVGSPLSDAAGNVLDQDPSTPGTQPFVLSFTQAGQRAAGLEGPGGGAGVVILGRYAYAAQNGVSAEGGRLVAHDLEDPTDPEEVEDALLPARPGSLTLVRGYAMPVDVRVSNTGAVTQQACEFGDWLAVITGTVQGPKQLSLYPADPERFGERPVRGVISRNPLSLVVKSKWDPPFLGYFELGADVTSISLLNLPAFRTGATATSEQRRNLPRDGTPGGDLNGDGDYCDPGEVAPLPWLDPVQPLGLAFTHAPADPRERIEDFDFLSGPGLVATLSRFPGGEAPDQFRVVLSADGEALDEAVVVFPAGARARRLLLLPGVSLATATNRVVRDLALVTLSTAEGGALGVLDITVPSAPRPLVNLRLPEDFGVSEGSPGSLVRRDDGRLALATARSVWLVEPGNLVLPPVGSQHPAFVGRIQAAAGGGRTFASEASGLNGVFTGATRQIVQAEPRFQVVTFGSAPIRPEDLAGQSRPVVEQFLRAARPVAVVEPARRGADGAVVPDLAPERHHYVLVDAPGGAGRTLPLVLAAVDGRGQLYNRQPDQAVPAVVGDASVHDALIIRQVFQFLRVLNAALDESAAQASFQEVSLTTLVASLLTSDSLAPVKGQLEALLRLVAKYPREFAARRLSDDPASPLYNRYLAGPFLVVPDNPEAGVVDQLLEQARQATLDRVYLRASPRLWVGLPSRLDSGNAVAPFRSSFRLNGTLEVAGVPVPGLETVLNAFLGDSSVIGPVLLSLAATFAPVEAVMNPTLRPGASVLGRVNFQDRPLVLVPGFAGSRLNGSDGELWPGFLGGRDKRDLAMRPDGSSVRPLTAPDALRYVLEVGDSFGVKGYYGPLIRFLTNRLGYVEYEYRRPRAPGDTFQEVNERRRRLDGVPRLNQQPTPTLFVYAYDWRGDSDAAAAGLARYVDLVRYYHPDADGIDLVSHSNGGFVARAYQLANPGVVKRSITLSVPWLGSAKPLLGMLSGDLDDFGVNFVVEIDAMRRISQFLPGFHQLLPNRGLFDLGFRPLQEQGWDINGDGRAYGALGYPEYAAALAAPLFLKGHAEAGFPLAASPARANHENFHRPADGLPVADASADGPEVEQFHLISMQAVPRSPAGMRFVGRLHQRRTNLANVSLELPALGRVESDSGPDPRRLRGEADGPLGITTNQFAFHGDLEVISTLGDGTVPVLSLARGYGLGGRGNGLNAGQARLYCLVSPAAADDEKVAHNAMMEHPATREWLRRILAGRAIRELSLTVPQPPRVGEGSPVEWSISASLDGRPSGTVTVLVDHGDGGSAARVTGGGSAAVVRHAYRQNGSYVVSIGATTADSLTGFTSRRVEVTNVPPAVEILGGSVAVALNETRIFTARVTDPGLDDTHTFVWRLNGRVLGGQESFAAAVNFDAAGEFPLEVTATDSDGAAATAAVTVTVRPGRLPAPAAGEALRLARPAAGPTVFDQQPQLLVRITGQQPGPLGTRGIEVRQRDRSVYIEETFLAPFLAGLGINLPPIRQILSPLQDLLADLLVRRTAGDSAQVNLFRRLAADGEASFDSIVRCVASGGPLEVEVQYLEGGVPLHSYAWRTNVPAGRLVQLRWAWEESTATLRVGGAGFLGPAFAGDELPPTTVESGPARAGDRLPPAVSVILNPATEQVEVRAQDQVTAADRLGLFLAFDASGDGRLEDDTFYELGTNRLQRGLLPTRPFAIVARDGLGNVSAAAPVTVHAASDFTLGNAGYCDRLEEIRAAVRRTFQEGLNAPAVADLFLLDRSHLWVFEQGSGACLWMADSCAACNGNFVPGSSDNDYQLFLPAHLARDYRFNAAERAEFLAAGPFAPETLEGDWYFKAPVGVDAGGEPAADPAGIVAWRYELPEGFTTPLGEPLLLVPRREPGGDLAEGFDQPFTPAEVIARTLTAQVTGDASLRERLPETTFFPNRREHFMFGQLDLELPPAVGSDPIGDAGMGRQLLLLKWVLEGEYVPLDPATGVNVGLPPLEGLFANLAEAGVPLAEGFEWGLLQEFGALEAGVATDLRATYGPEGRPLRGGAGSDIDAKQRKKLKKLGKAGIRAALARMAGDPDLRGRLTALGRAQYRAEGLASFEDFILRVATADPEVAGRVFGPLAQDRPTAEGPDLFDFLRLKKGWDDRLFREVLDDPGGYRRFVEGGLRFLREGVQRAVLPGYQADLERLLAGGEYERQQRLRNLGLLLDGQAPIRRGLAELRRGAGAPPVEFVVARANYGSGTVGELKVRRGSGAGPAGRRGAARAGTTEVTLPAGAPLSGEAVGDDPAEGPLLSAEALAAGETQRFNLQLEGAPLEERSELEFDIDVVDTDNALTVEQQDLTEILPAPVDLPPLMSVTLREPGGDALDDAEAVAGVSLRSPTRYLRRGEKLFVNVTGPRGLAAGDLAVEIQLPDGGDPLLVPMRARPDRPASYTSDPIPVGPPHPFSFREEGVVVFRLVLRGEVVTTQSYLLDLGEFAGGGIKVFYEEVDQSVVRVGAISELGARFFEAGDARFDSVVPANRRAAFSEFVEEAGEDRPEHGQADILHVSAHGSVSGRLVDDGGNTLFLPPLGTEAEPDLWGRDVEWAVLAACNVLNEQPPANGGPNALKKWNAALRGRRPAHGLLGAFEPISRDLTSHYRRFWQEVNAGRPITQAYVLGMEKGQQAGQTRPQPWAYIAHSRYLREGLARPLPDLELAPGTDPDFAFDASDVSGLNVGCERVTDGAGPLAPVVPAAWPAELPAEQRRKRVWLLKELEFGTYQPGGAGRHEERGLGGERRRTAVSSLADPAATARAWLEGRLGDRLPALTNGFLSTAVARDYRGDQERRRWTNGFSVGFRVVEGGLPVWGDEWLLDFAGDTLVRVAARVHAREEDAEAAPTRPVRSWESAWAEARARLGTRGETARLRLAELVWAPARLLGGDPAPGTYRPAWRLEAECPPPDSTVPRVELLFVPALAGGEDRP